MTLGRGNWFSVLLALLIGAVAPMLAGCAQSPEELRGAEQRECGIHTPEDAVLFYLEAALAGDVDKARIVVDMEGIPEDMLVDNLREAKGFVESAGGLQNLGIAEDPSMQMGMVRVVIVRVVDSQVYAEFNVVDTLSYFDIGIVVDDDFDIAPYPYPSSDPSY